MIFREDTWVCLDYLVDFKRVEFEQKSAQGNIRKIKVLSLGLLLDLLKCAIDSDDVTVEQERVLRMSLEKIKTQKS